MNGCARDGFSEITDNSAQYGGLYVSNASTLKILIAIIVVVAGCALVYLDVQLHHSLDNAAGLTAERDQLKAMVAQLNAQVDQLQAATQQLSAANAREATPELPVSVYFRRALLGGRSYVAEFSNRGTAAMAVAVDVVDSATHNHHTFQVDVAPGRPTPYGHFQGCEFEPGDTLTLSHDGFKPVSAQVR
jgi:outer membrane murein-binding lipoprotein Lpp